MVQLTVMFLQRFGDLQTEVWEDVRDVVEVGWLGVGCVGQGLVVGGPGGCGGGEGEKDGQDHSEVEQRLSPGTSPDQIQEIKEKP